MALAHSTAQRKATLEGTTGAVCVQDSTSGHGYNAGTIRILTGAAPSTAPAADQAETGTDLVDVTLPNPLFPATSSGTGTANAISNATILATGTAGYGRMKANGDDGLSSSTERRIQFSVGTSGTDMTLNTTAFVSGGTFTTSSLLYNHPA